MKRHLQPSSPQTQQPQGDRDVAHGSPYLTVVELAGHLRFHTVKACRRWLERNPGLPKIRRGARSVLYERRIVDAYVCGDLPKLRTVKSVSRRLSLVHDRSVNGGR